MTDSNHVNAQGEAVQALQELLDASLQAAAAYRAIFGRSAWNQRDQRAFAELERVGLRCEELLQAQKQRVAHEPLRVRMLRRGLPPHGGAGRSVQ
jgi:hypothetical protein